MSKNKRKRKTYRRNTGAMWQKRAMLLIGVLAIVMVYLLSRVNRIHYDSNMNQSRLSEHEKRVFFEELSPVAKENQNRYGVLASVTLAQAAIESDFGTSQLAAKYFNLFGVKGNQQNGVLLPTKEFIDNKWVDINDYFVVYKNWEDSIRGHGYLLAYGTSWNALQYQGVVTAQTYQQAAQALVDGGYATDPGYAKKVIQMIEQYALYEYDKAS